MRRRPPVKGAASAAERLVVALDVLDLAGALACARRLRGVVRRVKIGSPLFTAEGPEAIRQMRRLGFEVFLDLKFHDIPSTVEKSVRAAVRHRVWMLTIHACGQPLMLEAAARGAAEEAAARRLPRPLIVGVTVLTSEAFGAAVTRRALILAGACAHAGLDGVVVSAYEAAAVRRRWGPKLAIVCPGIRPAAASTADQRRVATPRAALAAGAHFLVVGRPITEAADPRAYANALIQEMDGCSVEILPVCGRRKA